MALIKKTEEAAKPPRRRGRPATGFDKTAYMREYMRKKRELARESKKR